MGIIPQVAQKGKVSQLILDAHSLASSLSSLLLFIYLVDDPPVTHSVAQVSSQGTSEPLDIRMFVGVLTQTVKTAM